MNITNDFPPEDKPLYPPLIEGEVSGTIPGDPADENICEGCS